jgi:uncharacterized protein (DUF1697 family)
LRGVNVGAHKRFKPAELTAQLADLAAINIGAAGTFSVPGKISGPALRRRILDLLPFKAEVMIVPAQEIVSLINSEPLKGERLDKSLRAFVTIMSVQPPSLPKLPLYAPDRNQWEVKVLRIQRQSALSLWRPGAGKILYPNEVIEKAFQVTSTTRSWSTMEKVGRLLNGSE